MLQFSKSINVPETETGSTNVASLKSLKSGKKDETQMKRYLVLLSFVFISTLAFAQSSLQDVVYLKNGSIIRGAVDEINPNQPVRIETADRNVFVFQWDEIERITKEPHPRTVAAPVVIRQTEVGRPAEVSKPPQDNTGLKRGYKGIVESGLLLSDYFAFKASYINAIQFNPYLSLGIGAGVIYYFEGQGGFPFFADFRVNFLNRKVSPYFAAGLGYSIGQGLLVNFTPGVTFKTGNKSAVNVGLGYHGQDVWWEEYWINGSYNSYLRFMHTTCLVVSFSF